MTTLEESRRIFCTEWKHFNLDNVFMTDESVFQLHRNTLYVWSSQKTKISEKGAKIYRYGLGCPFYQGLWKEMEQ